MLRPFLLRRLKVDVEKQMPKKYEHVLKCRLSKRQRFLYDDFMGQARFGPPLPKKNFGSLPFVPKLSPHPLCVPKSTKATLASGHFMSVINVLMQLRKVCNHPDLFEPRPVHSPLVTEGLCFVTASLVLRALDPDPFKVTMTPRGGDVTTVGTRGWWHRPRAPGWILGWILGVVLGWSRSLRGLG